MDEKRKEFLKRLRDTFRIEADEHIRTISAGLMELEKNPGSEKSAEVIETIFREAHSLKGAARSVDVKDVEAVCQRLEGAFSALKRGDISLTQPMYDLFHRTVNAITGLVSSTDEGGKPADRSNVRKLMKQLEEVPKGAVPPDKPKAPVRDEETGAHENPPDAPHPEADLNKTETHAEDMQFKMEYVKMPTAKLDPLFLQAEEMILVKMAAGQRVSDLREIDRTLVSLKAESAKRRGRLSSPGAGQKGPAADWDKTGFSILQDRVTAVARAAEQDLRTVRRMVDDHLESMKQVLMLPASTLVEGFQKFVRDLARDQDKEAELVISGAEIEIDKRILDELKDPLIHLLRNCVNHGIKKTEERARLHKPAKGTINLFFEIKDGRRLEILLSDDGEGIDAEQVRAAAVKAGLVSREAAEKLDRQDCISLIFKSGVTTSPIITDISGRGLGLAIVREKVEKLGGAVSVETRAGGGTTFRLLVSLSLATFRGVLVRVDEHLFIVPTINVERAARVPRENIRTVENRETIQQNGRILPLVRLGDVLELPSRRSTTPVSGAPPTVSVVVTASADARIAFQVDEILDEQQVLMKGLGRQLGRVRNIAGAAVLGTGRVVPVLNVPDLMKSAVRPALSAGPAQKVNKEAEQSRKILVAEDSITSRTLIKNILETAGYQVSTAIDGVDAFILVRSEEFDLVVSDVDMPRMSGFELTGKIRNDGKLNELPVVLVTALESREDRERGIEVGANAYIVKSSFDQSNLLEVIKRFI